MTKARSNVVSNAFATLGLLAAAVSFVANAEPAATAESESKPKAAAPAFYAGSSFTYGHAATVYTFSPGGEPHYNPTWYHRLEIDPEFHIGEQLFIRGRLSLSQEFTQSDATSTPNEFELQDIALEVGAKGWTEPFTKIHLGGNLRITVPTSKVSQAQTRILTLGPALALSRKFNVLSGLSLSYSGRYTYRFHRFTTGQTNGPTIEACGDARAPECQDFINNGRRNAHSDLTHGPSLSFAPFEFLSASATFQMAHSWLYPVSPTTLQSQGLDAQTDNNTRFLTVFDLNVSWQMFKPVGLTLGAFTLTPGLNPQGSNLFVLFNRNTTLYLDATVDIEAAVKGILGEST